MDIEDIAITGASGRFPNADSIDELRQALLNGIDLITDQHQRWPYESVETPSSMGIIHDFEHFDAAFFEINPKAADLHDPRGRTLLEVAFECIIDAGINPNELKGSKTGVFVGITQNSFDYDYLRPGSAIKSTTCLLANHVSYIFDFHGPSFGIDAGCSGSIYALNQAVESMRLGICDAAIVGGVHANLLPYDSVEINNLGVLNPDGRCKTFDNNRQGYVRSEGIVAVLLQKRHNARRIYATIRGIGCNVDGYKEDGLIHPSSRMQVDLLRDVYQRYGINPNDVTYVECHATGTLVGDFEECEGLAEFFPYSKRGTPLQIGSVKSNLGHTEAAAGLVSLIKLLIVIQSDVIPANLHYRTPANDIPSIFNGELNVVSLNTSYKGGLLAINSFGLGGTNSHLVIKPYRKSEHEQKQSNINIYRLVQASGRTEEAVETLLDKVNETKGHPGLLKLIDEILSTDIRNHNYKGYCILNSTKRYISRCPTQTRPIWFSYSGMGSQWPQMARGLIHFEVFRNSLNKCADAVEPYGVDLKDVVLNGTNETFEDTVNCFTSIVAVSIGLTDLLFSLGIKPDGIIGHSLGEIGCAYSDGLLTAEEATLIAYARGWATKNTSLIPGLMASVGLSAGDCQKLLPDDIYIACNNSPTNVTVSGPEESVRLFTEELSSRGIFVRVVNTANIAFHSKYISSVGPKFLEFLKNINFQPKPRKLWLPSAVSECQWGSNLGRYNSVDYQCHNFLNQVLYTQVLIKVPKNAIIIEIAPCGLFQAIFRRSLDESITKLYLVKKYCEDNHEFLLDSIGRLYVAGGQPKLNGLYGGTEYPLGPETPMLSPIVKWNHSVKWSMPRYDPNKFFGKKVDINMNSRENKFLLGHMVNGKHLLSVSGIVVLVWKTFANMMGTGFETMPIILEKFKLMKSTPLSTNDSVTFTINILKTGVFEVSDKMEVVATGKIIAADSVKDDYSSDPIGTKEICEHIKLNTEDVYKILYLRGYEYGENFKNIKEIDYVNNTAVIKRNKNWVICLDSMFQTIGFIENSRLVLPKKIFKISINPNTFKQNSQKEDIYLKYNSYKHRIICSGVKIHNIIWSKMSARNKKETIVKMKYEFVPNISNDVLEPDHVLQYIFQIVIENNFVCDKVKIMEVIQIETFTYKDLLKKLLQPKHLKKLEFYNTNRYNTLLNGVKYNLIIFKNLVLEEKILKFFEDVDADTFIYSEAVNDSVTDDFLRKLNFVAIFERKSLKNSHLLFRKKRIREKYNIIKLPADNFCLRKINREFEGESSNVLFIEENLDSGIRAIPNYFTEFSTRNLRVFSIKEAQEFSLQSPFYQQQLEKDLVINILRNKEWGTYRYSAIEEEHLHVDSCMVSFVNNQFQWVQQNPYLFKDSKVNVSYSSLDFWDNPTLDPIMEVQRNEEFFLGLDYSGVTDSGTQVMGISPSGSLKTHLNTHKNFTWTIPNRWNLKEASTVPSAYAMCYYGLFIKGNIQRYNTILIVYNATTVDNAAINLILNTGCKLFIAIVSKKDTRLLRSYFPTLENSIVDFSCKNDQNITLDTIQGQKVDVIFNCGSRDILTSLFYLLKDEGTVIDINFTKRDFNADHLDIILEKNCVLHTLTLGSLLRESDYVLENIRNEIQIYIDNNVIQPFYFEATSMSGVTEFLKKFKIIPNGKMVVEIHAEELLNGQNKKFLGQPRTYLNPDKCYIVISNLDIFDMEVISWFNNRGAKNIVLNHCNEIVDGYVTFCLENLRKIGSTVSTNTIDVTSMKGIKELIESAEKLGSIGGIFYLSYKSIELGKDLVEYHIVKNLDIASRSTSTSLDYFVVFSSRNSKLDEGIQLDTFHAQAAIEGVCQNRRNNNLPALAIQWGPIADHVSQFEKSNRSSEGVPQSIHSCLETLDRFMQLDTAICSSSVLDVNGEFKGSVNVTIIELIAKIFGIQNVVDIDHNIPLVNIGMDSIIGFELKSLLYSQFGINYSLKDIRKLTLEEIRKMEESKKNVKNQLI